MSGGYFNYRDNYLMSDIFGYGSRPSWYNEDKKWDDEEFHPKTMDRFEDVVISEIIYDVFELLHDFDWYKSGDTCQEDWIEAKEAFKKKWLNPKTSPDHLEELLGKYMDEEREYLMSSFGINRNLGLEGKE